MVIDGETVHEVSFSTKGTSSLVLASKKPDNSRYNFKIKFGRFVEGQTWQTLHELSLQGSFADATYMKDHLCYSLFRRMGVPAPRSSYVWLTINGEDYGLYLAVEEMDAQFLDQLDMAGGNLYKPDNDSTPKIVEGSAAIPEENATESAGADLVCTDDNVNRYTDIFDNTVTEKSPDSQERVVRSLHSLSDLRDLENHLDTQEIITYFAVHNFVGNYDSYTGPKPHNYYLYESDGKLALFPWDYNLAFGAFPSDGQFGHVSDSAWVINQGIDSFGLRIGG